LDKEKEEEMADAHVVHKETRGQEHEAGDREGRGGTFIAHILLRLAALELPEKEHFGNYLRYKWRSNHKPSTIEGAFASIAFFLAFYEKSRKRELKDIERADIEAFIEHEQDRGLKISTVRTRLVCIVAFFHWLIEQELIPGAVFKKRIRLKLPATLPRAMAPQDVKKLLSIIDHTRDRALILLLLRTGIRIGEALALTMNDVDLKEKKVRIVQGEKNDVGRVVYLSNDAMFCLNRWFRYRDPEKRFVFYGKGDVPICYSTARSRFFKYLQEAGLAHKGYTVHALRHTCASELLNAGMRLEVLQQLLGHKDIEMTRRYARLTDRTREDEYFRAMAMIEKGEIDGEY
jgi:integrase/recombinase XerD